MRLKRQRRSKDVAASITDAARACEEATGHLAAARDLIAVQAERARAERATIIAALRKMRASNNLARLIMDTVEKESGGDAGTAGTGTD
jgi:hypothetical protein